MKKLTILAISAAYLFAAGSVIPYGAYLKYSDKAVKDKGYVGGVYVSMFDKPFGLEMDGEHTLIKYKDKTPDWKQNDFTAIGHVYFGNNLAFKGGMHKMFIKQAGSPNETDKVYVGGITLYKYLKWDTGMDYYYSKYNGFDVKQYSPKVGYYFGDYYSPEGLYYVEAKINYIKISKSGIAPKDNYTNYDLKVVNSQGPWITTLKASLGKSAYKVDNGGFVVYNLGDEYKYNFSLGITYKTDKYDSIKFEYSRAKYDVTGGDAFVNAFLVSYTRAF
jgi:hypothetical protein